MNFKKLRYKIILAAVIFSFSFLYGQSNESIISGFIFDQATSETLIGANILIKDFNRGASSNLSGYYVIPRLDAGSYELIVSYVGYKTHSQKIILKQNENKRIDIWLKPDVIFGQEVVITADSTRTADNLFNKPVSKLELSQTQIYKVPRVIEADLLRTLQSLPGIVPISDFSSAIYVRGGTPDQNLFMVDGIDVYNPEHAFGLFSTFNTDAIKKVEVYKGGFSAEYGGRLSSVINIVNNDGNRNHFEGKASLSLLSLNTTLQTPIGSIGSLSGSVRRTYIDQTLAKWIDDVPDYYFIDGNLKATFDLGVSNKLSLSYFGSKDNLIFLMDKKRTESLGFNYTWGNQTGSLNWKIIITPKIFGNFWITASYFRSTFDFSAVNLLEDNVIRDYTLKGAVEYFYSDQLNFKFGFEQKNVNGGLKQNLPGGKVDVFKYRQLFSLYFTTSWQPSFLWYIEAGLRGDYFKSDIDFKNLDPRLSIKYRLDESSSLKFSTGIFHQYANRIPRLFFVSIWTTADEYLQGSTSDHFILGYQRALGEKFELEIEAYFKNYNNIYSYNQTFLADVVPAEYTEENLPIYRNQKGLFNRGNGNSYGIEFFLRKETGAITGWASYAYSKTLFNIDGINQGRSYEPRHDRTHAVNIIANIDLNNFLREFIREQFISSDKQWTLGLNLTYFSGQPITLPSSVYLVNQFPDWMGNKNSLAIYPSTINSFRLPYYARFDISLTYEIQYDGWSLSPYIQVFNLFNRKNVWFIQYNNEIKDGFVKQEIENVNMFPFLPSIGISVKF
ncbi:MAG: TonB-dependent receptor [Ignavibacteriales bacterium]|nr:TonB-dependent receptor [Ignavibacteriales bacterium]